MDSNIPRLGLSMGSGLVGKCLGLVWIQAVGFILFATCVFVVKSEREMFCSAALSCCIQWDEGMGYPRYLPIRSLCCLDVICALVILLVLWVDFAIIRANTL